MEQLSWYAIKGILAAFGPKVTAGLAVVYFAYQAVKGLAAFFERSQASRDAMFREMRLEVAEINRQRAEVERDTAQILGAIRADIDSSLNEQRDTRKEMHQRFNKLQEDVTTIKGAVS